MEKKINDILNKYIEGEGNVISLLQDAQETFGYIPENVVDWFSKKLDIPESRFFGIATFYAQFHLKPRGKNIITACCGTACHVKGSEKLISTASRELNLKGDEDTTEDGEITFEKVACLGTCSMAPVVIINKKMHGKMTTEKLAREIKSITKAKK
ncbi:MAG: NAD(P)H-dependent oxidoreductase subunit E [Nitrospirae bacterium]|nr:NAD(P)H-dependent oxidoreductase subunit E [Nitrospirota bacterium]